ncbi:MAG: hypothetical protein V1691_00260 [Chloroflexota bacterium]
MKRIWLFGGAMLVIFIIAGLLLHGESAHGALPGTDLPGFYAVFGFIASVVIIAVARGLGRLWLERKESYYQDHRDGDNDHK